MSRLVWADGVSMVWFRECNNMLTECRLVASGAAYYQLHMQSTPWYVYEVHPFAFKSWSITYQSGWWFGTLILFFHILGNNTPIWLNIFKMVETTNQSIINIHWPKTSTDCLHIGCPKSTFVSAKLLEWSHKNVDQVSDHSDFGIFGDLYHPSPYNYPKTESYINITRSSLVLQKTLWDTLKRCPRKP